MVLAASLGLTLGSIDKAFNHLKACREGLQIGVVDRSSHRLGTVDAVQRFLIGLRSQAATEMMDDFESCPPLLPRWMHSCEFVRWDKSGSLELACLEKYFPG